MPLGPNDLPLNYKTKVGIVMADKFSLISNVLENNSDTTKKKNQTKCSLPKALGWG